jgi:hypothetical protein
LAQWPVPNQRRRLGKVHQLFGADLSAVVASLDEALAALNRG